MEQFLLKQSTDSVLQNQVAVKLQSPADLKSVTWFNLPYIKPEWLLDDGIAYSLKLFVDGLAHAPIPFDCYECFTQMNFLIKQVTKLPIERPDLFAEYIRMLAVLKACFFINLDEADTEKFLREELLYVLEVQDFDFTEKMYDALMPFKKDPKVFHAVRKRYQQAVESNRDYLGSSNISIGNSSDYKEPSLSNWILDYNQFSVKYSSPVKGGVTPNQDSKVLGGSLERVAYLQKNSNANRLDKEEKTILFKLLEFYDWLKNLKIDDEFTPFSSNYFQADEMSADGDLSEEIEVNKEIGVKPAPIVPAPSNKPIAKKVDMNEIGAKPTPEALSKFSAFNKLSSAPTVTAENLAAKIEKSRKDAEGRGVNQGPTTINYINQQKPTTSNKAEEVLRKQIDEKLHNLDEKVHKKNN